MSIGKVQISSSVNQFFSSAEVTSEEKTKLAKITAKFADVKVDQKLSVFKPQYWKVRSGLRELSKFTDQFIQSHPKFLDEKKAMDFERVIGGLNIRPAKHIASEVLSRMNIAEGPKDADPVAVINNNIRGWQQKIQENKKTLERKNTLRNLGRKLGPVGIVGGFVGLVALVALSPFTFPVFIAAITVMATVMVGSFLATFLSVRPTKQGIARDVAMATIKECERYKEVVKKPEFTEWLKRHEASMNDFKSNDFKRVEKAILAYEANPRS